MNERDIELCAQAGIAIWGDAVYMYDPKDTLDSAMLEKLINKIRADEREACAKVCEEQEELRGHTPFDCAAAIRERGLTATQGGNE